MASEVKIDNHAKFVSTDPNDEKKKAVKKRTRKPKVATPVEELDHQAIKEAKKNERQSLKVPEGKTEKARMRERFLKTPISYYYNVAIDIGKETAYCNIYQYLNDKLLGRVYQPQYFAIAEQSDRIFFVNPLLINQAKGVALLNPDMNFVVQVSAKYLENRKFVKQLEELLVNIPKNLILSFDARSLVMAGEFGKRNLMVLTKKYNLTLMLDQVETERMTILFDYPIKYIRLDARYYKEDNEAKHTFVKLVKEYCYERDIVLCARYVDTKVDRSWAFSSGVKYIEGQLVQPIKSSVANALRK